MNKTLGLVLTVSAVAAFGLSACKKNDTAAADSSASAAQSAAAAAQDAAAAADWAAEAEESAAAVSFFLQADSPKAATALTVSTRPKVLFIWRLPANPRLTTP